MDSSRRWLEKYNDLKEYYGTTSKYVNVPADKPMDSYDITGRLFYNEDMGKFRLNDGGYFAHEIKGNQLTYTEPTRLLFDDLLNNEHQDKKFNKEFAMKKGMPIYIGNDSRFYFVPHKGHPLYFENNVRADKSLEILSAGGRKTNMLDPNNKQLGLKGVRDLIRKPRVSTSQYSGAGSRENFRRWDGDVGNLAFKTTFVFRTPTLKKTKQVIKFATPKEKEQIRGLSSLLQFQKKRIAAQKDAKRQKEMVERYLTNITSLRRAKETGRLMARPRKRLNMTRVLTGEDKVRDEKYKGYRATLARGRTGASRRKHPNPTKFNDMNRKRPDFYQRTTERQGGTARVDGSERRGFTQQFTQMPVRNVFNPNAGPEMTRTRLQPRRPEYAPRGIRDPRTYRGEAREARRRLLNDRRYISATEQAIIDRKIRNTEAEAKRESDIKAVRDAAKKAEERLNTTLQQKEAIIKDIQKQNQGLIHSHDMLGRMRSNATLIGSNADLLNPIIARGGAYMAMLKSMVRNGEITKSGTIAGLNISIDEKHILQRILNEGNEYQEGKDYFFKEITDSGEVKIFKGKLVEGGERGSNLKLRLPDRRTKIVRVRDVITPDEAAKLKLKPSVIEGEFVSGRGMAERDFREIQQLVEADESAVGVWLGHQQEHQSSSESSISSLEGGGTGFLSAEEGIEQPPPLEAVGTPEAEARGLFDQLTSETIQNKERRRARIQQNLERLEAEDEASRTRIRELTKMAKDVDNELRFDRGRANKLATEIGIAQPYPTSQEEFEASRIALQSFLDAVSQAEEPQPEQDLDAFLDEIADEQDEEGAEVGGGLPAGLGDGAEPVQIEEPIEEEDRPPPIEGAGVGLEEAPEEFSFSRSEWNTKDLKQTINEKSAGAGEGEGRVMIWSTKFPTEWRNREGGVKGLFITKKEFEKKLDEAGTTAKTKSNLLDKWDKARRGKLPEFAMNNQRVLTALGLMTGGNIPDQRSFTGQLD